MDTIPCPGRRPAPVGDPIRHRREFLAGRDDLEVRPAGGRVRLHLLLPDAGLAPIKGAGFRSQERGCRTAHASPGFDWVVTVHNSGQLRRCARQLLVMEKDASV